jgi:hypothetical protein
VTSHGPVTIGSLPCLTMVALACGKDEWHGFVYPGEAFDSRDIGTFSSLEECRAAARAYLQRLDASGTGDYECGLNCRAEPDYTGLGTPLHICTETLR